MTRLFNILRAKVSRSIITYMLLIHLLNYSIDQNNASESEDRFFLNDEIESIVELMCEEILDRDNFFGDVEETGTDKNNVEKAGPNLLFVESSLHVDCDQPMPLSATFNRANIFLSVVYRIFEITTPPPEISLLATSI